MGNLIDLAALVLKFPSSTSYQSSIPLPESCAIASGSQIQSIVTVSGFLEPGKYAILPLAFNHWLHHSQDSSLKSHTTGLKKRSSDSNSDANSVPYVVALHTGREVTYHEHVATRPGFLAESLFLLAKTSGRRSNVSRIPSVMITAHVV